MAGVAMIGDFTPMKKRFLRSGLAVSAVAAAVAGAAPAVADTLRPAADAPWLAHLGAGIVLAAHIGGGAAGIALGALVFAARKGGVLHRRLGLAFVAAMFPCYLVGAAVAPFLETGQRVNATAGVLALYLLASGWMTARRKAFTAGIWEGAGLALALAIVTLGVTFAAIARTNGTGTVDGSPPQAFFLFTIVGGLAALGEAHVLIRRRLRPTQRIARHLWRMGLSFFIAAGSFFFGQEQVLPAWLRGTPLQLALGLGPLALTFTWLAWTLRPRFRPPAPTASG